jgi:hypothetical protein
MRFLRKFIFLPIALLFVASSVLHAQYEFKSSWIMAEEGRAQQVFVGVKVLVGVDVKFSNLGSIPYIQGEDSAYTYEFNDGYINIQNPDGEFTSEFGFLYKNSTEGSDGNVDSFTLTRYRSSSIGESFESSFDYSTGWELGSRYDMWKLSNRLTMGFTVAGGFTPLRKKYANSEIIGELYKQTVTVPLSGPGITYVESGSYTGSRYGGPYILLDDLHFDTDYEELVTQILPDGSTVIVDALIDGKYELLGGLGTFRTGAYFDIYLTERLMLHFGVGLSISYLSFDFSVDQSLSSTTLSEPYRIQSNTSRGEWLPGVYAELNLVYRLNQRTSVYAGAQSHFIAESDPIVLDDVLMEVTMGSPTQLQAGFEFDF